MAIYKILHTCTAGIYRNFSNQSSSQQVLRVAFPLIALGAVALFVRWQWTATTGSIRKNSEPTDNTKNLESGIEKANNNKNPEVITKKRASDFSTYLRSTEEEYTLNLDPIPCIATNHRKATSDLEEASKFFDQACDNEGDIRLWSTDDPRKMQKDGFMDLAQHWTKRGGKFIWPEINKPVVVDSNTLCLPWCHEGKNRSALVYDYLMRAGHHETLLPEGAKEGYLFPSLESMDNTEDGRYPVIKDKTGFQNGKVFRIGDKFLAEGIDCRQGFTDLFNQLATVNKPVMIFAFVSAVPILMREIMNRTEAKNLGNITIVGFYHDDPMTVLSPLKKDQVIGNELWVVENHLEGTLYQAQNLYKQWNEASTNNAKLRTAGKGPNDSDRTYLTNRCGELSREIAPLEETLFFHRRRYSVHQFQHEVLAQLISVQ